MMASFGAGPAGTGFESGSDSDQNKIRARFILVGRHKRGLYRFLGAYYPCSALAQNRMLVATVDSRSPGSVLMRNK